MFTTVLSVALLSTLAIRGVRSDFVIDTPEIAQCQDVPITWQGGQSPYNLIVVPSDDPCDGVLADLGDTNNQSITWKADIAAGTQLVLSLEDATGEEAWSGTITVGGSNDTSCLAAASSTSASTASSSTAAPLADVTPGTTLTVPPDTDTAAAAAASTAAAPSSSDGAAIPVGAANAGVLPDGNSNGASGAHKLSALALASTVLAAVFAVGL